jgi:EAL domain-containing protein (putative c-di-GMP-specific phosphodiesterase class I)
MNNGCDMGQGYWMSRPLPADEAGRWLTEPHPELPPVR